MKSDLFTRRPDEITEDDRVQARRALEQLDELSVKLDLEPFDFEQFKTDREMGRL